MESSAACCGTSVRAGGRASAATAAKSRQARSPAQQLRVRAAGRLAKAEPLTEAAPRATAAACRASQRRRARRPARRRRSSGNCPAGATELARAAAVAARWRRHACGQRCRARGSGHTRPRAASGGAAPSCKRVELSLQNAASSNRPVSGSTRRCACTQRGRTAWAALRRPSAASNSSCTPAGGR